MFAAVEVFEEDEHEFVGLAFDVLEAVVEFLGAFELLEVAELADEGDDSFGGLAHEVGLFGEVGGADDGEESS